MLYMILMMISLISTAEDIGGERSMNQIQFSDDKNFSSRWELITIRFRKDTGEMRLTYANAIRRESLKVREDRLS